MSEEMLQVQSALEISKQERKELASKAVAKEK